MRGDRGQAIVEFALVLPTLLVVALAIVLVAELGVARLALQHATAEAARAGALTNDDEQIRGTLAATVAPLSPDRVTSAIAPKRPTGPAPRTTARRSGAASPHGIRRWICHSCRIAFSAIVSGSTSTPISRRDAGT